MIRICLPAETQGLENGKCPALGLAVAQDHFAQRGIVGPGRGRQCVDRPRGVIEQNRAGDRFLDAGWRPVLAVGRPAHDQAGARAPMTCSKWSSWGRSKRGSTGSAATWRRNSDMSFRGT